MYKTGCLLFVIIIIVCDMSYAGSREPASADFNQGVKYFKKGNYEKAVEYFYSAQDSGMDTKSLHYNIGVCCFKLKQYGKSKAQFELIAKTAGSAPLAHYNLGLIALKAENQRAAAKHFQITYRTAENTKLKRLSADQIRKINSAIKPRKWSGFFSIGGGYEDNVGLTPDDREQVDQIDAPFMEIFALAKGQLSGNSKNGVQLKVNTYALDYKNADEYDFGDLRVGAEWDHEFGQWETEFSGNLDLIYFDRELYENIWEAGVKSTRQLNSYSKLRLRYRLSQINADKKYDYLTGIRHKFNTEVRFVLFNIHTVCGYALELNDRKDEKYPDRHEIYGFLDTSISPKWSTGLTAGYKYSDYKEINRADKRGRLGIIISRSIFRGVRVYWKYQYIQNLSNIDRKEYTVNTFTSGVEGVF